MSKLFITVNILSILVSLSSHGLSLGDLGFGSWGRKTCEVFSFRQGKLGEAELKAQYKEAAEKEQHCKAAQILGSIMEKDEFVFGQMKGTTKMIKHLLNIDMAEEAYEMIQVIQFRTRIIMVSEQEEYNYLIWKTFASLLNSDRKNKDKICVDNPITLRCDRGISNGNQSISERAFEYADYYKDKNTMYAEEFKRFGDLFYRYQIDHEFLKLEKAIQYRSQSRLVQGPRHFLVLGILEQVQLMETFARGQDRQKIFQVAVEYYGILQAMIIESPEIKTQIPMRYQKMDIPAELNRYQSLLFETGK